MANDPSHFDYTNPQLQYSAEHSPLEPRQSRPRESSTGRADRYSPDHVRFNQPHQPPISEAVSSALNKDPANNYVAPEIIAQITEHVIKQLKTSGIDSGPPVLQTHNPSPPSPPLPIQQPIPLSPSTASATSPLMHTRNVYTPPSPPKHPEYPNHGSPETVPSAVPMSSREPPKVTFKDRRPSSPLSQSSDSGYTRPRGPTRLSTGRDETTLEKIWSQLFDEEGNPTARLGQFLRGLAVHIVRGLDNEWIKGDWREHALIMCRQIEDYEPFQSIVITPAKMVQYYEDVKLSNEIYPWSGKLLFGAAESYMTN